MKSNSLYPLLAPALFLLACSPNQQETIVSSAPIVPVTTVVSVETTIFTEYPAKLEGVTDVEIRSQVEGILEKILVTEGSYVSKGTPLFQIDARSYREHYNNAEAELTAAKEGVSTARIELEKITPLVRNNVVSEFQLKTAESAFKAAQAHEKQAKSNFSNAGITLGYTIIKAPVNGYVGRIFKKTGSLVSPSDAQQLTYLSDNHEIQAYFTVGENDFIKLKENLKGNTIKDKLKNAPAVSLVLTGESTYAEKGRLDMIDAAFDRTTGAITIRATFPNPEGLLKSGNSGRVKLGFLRGNVISVPQAATMETLDKVYIYTVGDSSKVQKIALDITGTSGTSYLISRGLKSGDKIVLKGMNALKDGMKITPEAPKPQIVKN